MGSKADKDGNTADCSSDFELKVKLYLADPQGNQFMGIGVLWLLQHIDSFGSIRKAAAHMNLSYVKAHRMLTDLEQHLQLKIVERKKGGERREGASLTPAGRRFMEVYDRFQAAVKRLADPLFAEFKSEIMREIKTGSPPDQSSGKQDPAK
ncbi:MAG: winged helix-turn-helix domain-containing protein [bacterium]